MTRPLSHTIGPLQPAKSLRLRAHRMRSSPSLRWRQAGDGLTTADPPVARSRAFSQDSLSRRPEPGRTGKNVTASSTPGLADRLRAFYLRSDAAKGYALLSPVMITMVVLLAAPLVMLILYSFWTQQGLAVDHTLTTGRYQEVIGKQSYHGIFWRTIGTSSLVTLVTVGLAYPMAPAIPTASFFSKSA